MDPTEIGMTAATLVATKALAEIGKDVGAAAWDGLGRIRDKVYSFFRDAGNSEGLHALDVVDQAPDSSVAVERLAQELSRAVRNDRPLADDLELLIQEAAASGPELRAFVTNVQDNAKVGRIVQVSGTYVERGDC